MEQETTELVSLMERLVSLHQELIPLEEEKIGLIIDQNWAGLEEQVQKSGPILLSIEDTERRRMEIVGRLGGTSDQPLSEIASQLPVDTGSELQRSGRTLRTLLLELKNLNLQEEQLITSSLEVVEFTLSLFSGRGSKSN